MAAQENKQTNKTQSMTRCYGHVFMKPPRFEQLSFVNLMCVVAPPQQEVPPPAEAPLPPVRYCPVDAPGVTPTRVERVQMMRLECI